MLTREEYVKIKRDYSDKTFKQLDKDYNVYSKKKKWVEKTTGDCFTDVIEYTLQPRDHHKSLSGTNFCLAPLPKAVPASTKLNGWKADWIIVDDVIKEEGKTPMRYNDNYASASANVTTIQSDAATQRDYLLNRLAKADYPKDIVLANLFNLYVDNTPRTFKDLIDAIKNDKFSIDKKAQKRLETAEENDEVEDFYFGGPLSGIIWAGPQPDRKGYEEASKEKGKQYTAAKDLIMVSDAAEGLKALQAFEAWSPSVTASSDTAH